MDINEVSKRIIGSAIDVHKELGSGLLESAYEECLCHELILRNICFTRQVVIPVRYKGVQLESGFRMDLLVENSVVVELKSVERLMPIHDAQLLTYLRLANKTVGLLINFNVPILKQGIRRKVLKHVD